MDQNYLMNLENVIKQMLTPLKNIPLNLVIEATSGFSIVPFDFSNQNDLKILSNLKKVAKETGSLINKKGIKSIRPNEVGNYIEDYVKKTLNKIGYESEMPKTISGKHRSAGYPDLLFKDDLGKINYLECKTFSIENVSTTLRSFYLSPSNDSKITEAAHHFVISFEVYVYKKESDKNIYKIKSWKILTVEKLLVDVKYEFNSDNLRLYSKEHLLAEGII